MRSGASHPRPHWPWIPALPCHRASGAVTCSSLATLRRSPRRSEACCRFAISRSLIRNHCDKPLAFLLQRAGRGKRPQRPRTTSRADALFWMIPAAILSRKPPSAAALPQSSGKLRNSHVSLETLSSTSSRAAIQKPASLVKKLWTMCLPCGSSWKTNTETPAHGAHKAFSVRVGRIFVRHPSRPA